MVNLLQKTFNKKKVLVTGHTGFKGSWLAIWLKELGAEVIGYSLDPPTKPNNFELTKLSEKIIDIRGDILDKEKLNNIFNLHQPEIIFHLAAQAIVLTGFENPSKTFETNVQGTINVLETSRNCKSVKTVIVVTSDKCYKDQGMISGYREDDLLGGSDPYSASKSMAEIAINSYIKSFYNSKEGPLLASVRAGNVIGGGDFADFRLVPDCMKALMSDKSIIVRNPSSVRPWQHVLVPLSGYLTLAERLQENRHEYADAWNFGPAEKRGITTKEVVEQLIDVWGEGTWQHVQQESPKKETVMLRLNWDKAAHHLSWAPAYNYQDALKSTVDWFKKYYNEKDKIKPDLYSSCVEQIKHYTQRAIEQKIQWALDIDIDILVS